jgi:hypothetical protein
MTTDIVGRRSILGKPVDGKRADDGYRCQLCGAWVEYQDLGKVLAHEGPLPHLWRCEAISHIATAERVSHGLTSATAPPGLGGIRRGRAGQRQWLRRERRPVSVWFAYPHVPALDGKVSREAASALAASLPRLSRCPHPDVTPLRPLSG